MSGHSISKYQYVESKVNVFIFIFLTCLICFMRKTAESDLEKWMKFLFLKPRPCSADMLPLFGKYFRLFHICILSQKGTQFLHDLQMYESSPVTAGPLVEKGLNPVHHLLAVLRGGDIQVHVAVPHVAITNHPGGTLTLQSFLVKRFSLNTLPSLTIQEKTCF